MTELDRWQEDARAELEMSGAQVTLQEVNELADRMRRKARLMEHDRTSDAERRRRAAMLRRVEG
jgi:hypothetical protein